MKGRRAEDPVRCLDVKALHRPVDVTADVLVENHHALWLAGRARGVEDIGEVVISHFPCQAYSRITVNGRLVDFVCPCACWRGPEADDRKICSGDAAGQKACRRVADERLRRAVTQDVFGAIGRRLGIDRHINGAGPEDAEQGGETMDGTCQAEHDPVLPAHPQTVQGMTETVAPLGHFRISQRQSAVMHGYFLWSLRGPVVDFMVDRESIHAVKAP